MKQHLFSLGHILHYTFTVFGGILVHIFSVDHRV